MACRVPGASQCRRRSREPRRPLLPLLPLTLALVLMLAGGCSLFGPAMPPPSVSIDGVNVSRAGLFSQELMLTLRFRNRMARDLAIDSIRFDLDVNGDRLGSGLLLKSLTLPAEGELSVDVPVKVSTADLVDTVVRLGQAGRLEYGLDGSLLLGGADAGRSLDFDDGGALSLPDQLPAGLGA